MPKRRVPIIAEEIRSGHRPQGAELTEADIGKLISWTEFGAVLPCDVGKQVWLRSAWISLESAEQRDARKEETNG